MSDDYRDEDKRKLQDLKEKLADVQLEKEMTFSQDGLHIWSDEVSDQFSEFNKEIANYKQQIAKIENRRK